jgi:hypothetical protein
MTASADNSQPRREAKTLLKVEYEAIFAAMDTPESRAAAKCAFDAGPEAFRRPLKSNNSALGHARIGR